MPDTRLKKFAVASTVAASLVLAVGTAGAASGQFSKLAERLAELRSEVDGLTGQVESKKTRLQSRLRSIQRQRSDLEMQIEKEQMRVDRIRQKIAKHKEKMEARKSAADDVEPAVKQALATVRESVEQGPPFKRSERLAELDKLAEQMDEGVLSPQKVASRSWQFVEDELRLSRESGLYSQVIDLNGREVLADIARIGMVAMYFKTDDGRVGVAERTDGAWSWRVIDEQKQKRRVETLFESFKKSVRVGYFELPTGLRGIERIGEESP
jgi:hypothetical protein